MQAFTAASDAVGNKYLNECVLYVTLEPCVMCAGAAFWTRIGRVVFGAYDEKHGAMRDGKSLFHHATVVEGGLLQEECGSLLSDFFRRKRL
jgi:tRNA(adenine34) deaminase